MALHDDWLRDAGLPANAIKGVFCLSTTFNRRMVNPNAAPDHVPKEPFTAIAPDSPLALADRARTPFFIAWGGNEDERLERTGRQMIDALKRVGCPVESHVAPGRDHFEVHLDMRDPGDHWTQRVRAWMAAKTLPPA
jgi:dipeptidyl aminopeptidase/acylaminoacyl peptidase